MRVFGDIIKIVCSFLNREHIPYVIVGAVSVSYHGIPRTTHDIDLIISLEPSNILLFVKFLNENGFDVSNEEIESALAENTHFTVFDNQSPFRLDIWAASNDFEKKSLERRIKIRFYDTDVWINSAEDLIIAKIIFGSDRDVNDINGILKKQKSLDRNYLIKRSQELGIENKLAVILRNVDNK